MRRAISATVIVTVVTAVILACSGVSGGPASTLCSQISDVQARLHSRQSQWKSGTSLELEFAVVNVGKKAFRFDGRMSWPGNISLMAQTPSGEVLVATNMCVKMAKPSKSDIVILEPDRLYGSRLLVEQGDHFLTEKLRRPRRGRYLFWVQYYGVRNDKLNCRDISIKSNKVAVEVR